MEFTLHRQLKERYAPHAAATEVKVGPYRIDAVRRGGELVEIQVASLAAIRRKVERLLEEGHRVRVVKPIVARRRLVRQEEPDGEVVRVRWSPRRGTVADLFNELVFFAKVFPHPRLVIEAPRVEVEEWRLPLGRRKRRRFSRDYRIKDVSLLAIEAPLRLRTARDLWRLIPARQLPSEFGTAELAAVLNCSRWMAQRAAYCLRHSGAVVETARRRSGCLYRAA